MAEIKAILLTRLESRGAFNEAYQHYDTKVEYRVDKVTDSVEYHPNQFLQKNEIEELCNAAAWRVTIQGEN